MAHTLNLVYGSTTVALASGDYRIARYKPDTPDEGAEEISETAVIQVTGATLAALQANLKAIQTALEHARLFQDGKTYLPVYVQFQGSGESLLWQSEVLAGRVVLPDTALQADWANLELEVAVIWTRRAIWEAASWIAVPLTNGNGTNQTGGLNIYNCNDGSGSSPNKRNNYATIAAADVLGDLPGPVKLQFAVPAEVKNIYIGLQANLNGTGLVQPWAEAEDFTFSPTYGTETADADYSGGNYLSYHHLDTLPTHRSTISLLANLSAYSGSAYRFFVRWNDALTGNPLAANSLRSRFSVADGAWDMQNTSEVYNGAKLLEPIGDLFLPPSRLWLPSGTLKSFLLSFSFYSELELLIALDCFFWLPLDSYIQLGSDQLYWTTPDAYNPLLTYAEGLDKKLYATYLDGSSPVNYFDRVYGAGLFLYPGVDQRMHFLFGDDTPITATTSVQCWYKPRRVTL